MQSHEKDNGLTRRDVLQRGLAGAAGLALLGTSSAAGAPRGRLQPARLARSRPPRARSVIQIWMWGGPCHIDTFDPKPEAGYDYCGPLKDAIETNISGIRLGASLPRLARQADKFSIIRGMTHGVNAHETASYLVQTGRRQGRVVFPSVGAVVSLFKGRDHGYKGLVPPYIVLTQSQGRFSEAGFLGQRYKPFCTGGDPNRDPFAVEGIVAEGISDKRQQRRRQLLHTLDTLGKVLAGDPLLVQIDKCEQHAYDMMFGDARKLFDLRQEKDTLRQRYGRNSFGQSCLMARRLVEAGVPYITINYKGWDTHRQHFQIMQRKLPELDQGLATLLEDLAERGLLDSTIVWYSGEFGRTPRVMWNPPWNGGRGHWGQCFSAVVAGGGFRGGQVVGKTNKTGEEVVERPVSPRDLIASIYHQLGIDPDGPLPNPRGIETSVLPPAAHDAPTGGLLAEIMA